MITNVAWQGVLYAYDEVGHLGVLSQRASSLLGSKLSFLLLTSTGARAEGFDKGAEAEKAGVHPNLRRRDV